MAITIELPESVEVWLTERAARRGTTPSAAAVELLTVAAGRTFDDILAPFRRSVAESGVSDAELDELIEQARQEAWDEKHPPGQPA